ncbi:MAG: HDIG domain-containing protein [Bacteroidales bacterium]|nr:HDIG domain-containing protein [Bacteroidales bacterium]
MKKNIIGFLLHNKIIFIALIFTFFWLLIYKLIYNKRVYFPYEYEIGKVWKYKNLISEYDFYIFKDNISYKKEIDSIKNYIPLYFIFDENANQSILNKIKALKKDSVSSKYNKLETIISQYILPDSFEYIKKTPSLITIINDNKSIREEKLSYELETLNEVKKNILADTTIKKHISTAIIKDLKPNLIFYKDLYDSIYNESIKLISNIDKVFKKGDIIISNGEVITPEKHKYISQYKQSLNNIKNKFAVLGGLLYLLVLFIFIFLFLFYYEREILLHITKSLFIMLIITLFVYISTFFSEAENIYLISFTLIPIIIRSFYDSRTALFIYIMTILIIAPVVISSLEFIFTQFIAGVTATLSLVNVRKRGQLFITALLIFLSYSVSYTCYELLTGNNIINIIKNKTYLFFAGNAAIVLASYPIIYIFEKFFGFVSEVTLIELTNTNHPLLRLLAEKAPGTFQHSLMLANLAEEISYKIHANPLLVRAGALFHDVGKIGLPMYFTENQIQNINPHKDLQYDKSIEIITGHVSYGVELARKYKLPQPIIDFIETHHGTSIMLYFYKTYKSDHIDEYVDVNNFRYKGRKPQTKEQALIMLVDAVEAASHTLKEFTPENIEKLVENIIKNKLEDHQLDEANITLKEINTIIEMLKIRLLNIYHNRIIYPE